MNFQQQVGAERVATREILALTSLRGVAALGIVLFHQRELFGVGPDLVGIPFSGGYLLVDLFFILSGFIMSHVHGRDFEIAELAGERYARFIELRLARIWPVHASVLALFLIIEFTKSYVGFGTTVAPFQQNTMPSFVENLALVQAWGFDTTLRWNIPSWSISTEWAAYLLTPFIFRATLRSGSGAVIAAACALAGLWLIYADADTLYRNLDLGVPRCLAEYTIGCVMYRLYRDRLEFPALWRLLAGPAGLGIVAGAAIGLVMHANDLLVVGLFALTILALATGSGVAARLLSFRPLVWLGQISYSLYMIHYLVTIIGLGFARHAVGDAILPRLACAVVVTLTSLALAVVLWVTVERPARQMARHLLSRRRLVPGSV